MKLYSFWQSSSAWRVRIALAYKQIDYETVAVDLRSGEQHHSDYGAHSPLHQVPTLEWDAEGGVERLTQSLAIIELLEELVPEPPLLPADRTARARARELAEMINAGIQPLQNMVVLDRLGREPAVDPRAFAKHFISRGLMALERRAAVSAGRYLVGDHICVADLLSVPQLDVSRRLEVDLSPFPTLLRCEAAADELPAFQRARPEQQPDAPTAPHD